MEDVRSFRKHKEVRSTLHRDYVHKGRIEVSWGKHYDWLFENRQKAYYRPMVQFDPEQVKEIVEKSDDFVKPLPRVVDSRIIWRHRLIQELHCRLKMFYTVQQTWKLMTRPSESAGKRGNNR